MFWGRDKCVPEFDDLSLPCLRRNHFQNLQPFEDGAVFGFKLTKICYDFIRVGENLMHHSNLLDPLSFCNLIIPLIDAKGINPKHTAGKLESKSSENGL